MPEMKTFNKFVEEKRKKPKFEVSQDLAHISLWMFFFMTGGLFGQAAGMSFVIPLGLILAILALTVRNFFMSKVTIEIRPKSES